MKCKRRAGIDFASEDKSRAWSISIFGALLFFTPLTRICFFSIMHESTQVCG